MQDPSAPFEAASPAHRVRKALDWRRTFAALKHRNYRLWYVGQVISLLGTWMQTTAQGYLVYELTRSPAYLGYVGFAAGAPSWLFMLYGGVIADRFSRRSLLVITQVSMMLLAFALAVLAALQLVQPWHVLVLALLTGVVTAFDVPARQSFVLEMVGREDLGNAIALNSAMFNLALIIGPAAAGIAYAAFGPALCFFVNGISFIAVIVALLMMRLPAAAETRAGASTSMLEELKEGVRYAVGHPKIRAIMLLAGTTTLFGFSFVTLIPAWAVDVLGGDARTNGYLFSARGVGALLGALLIASTGHLRIRGRMLSMGTFAFPVLVFLFAEVRSVALALALTAMAGVALIQIFNVANALVQTLSPDRLRGRVMGVYSLVFFGLAPLGALWIGPAAQAFGNPLAVKACAVGSFLCGLLVFRLAPELKELE